MVIRSLILLTTCVVVSQAVLQCCPRDNFLNRTKCSDGSSVIKLDCEARYLLNPNLDRYEDFEIVDDYLTYKKYQISPKRYCITNLENQTKPVAVVCVEEPEEESFVFRTVCVIITIIFLFLTLLTYMIVPRLQDVQGKCTAASIVSLIIGFSVLAVLQFSFHISPKWCQIVAYLMYLGFIQAFVWLNIISFNIWRTTVKPNMMGTEAQWYLIYKIYGTSVPIVLLIIVIVATTAEGTHLKPGFGDNSCWFAGKAESWAYFYTPIAIIMIANSIFFVWSSIHMKKQQSSCSPQQLKILRYKFWLYLKLFFVMGLSWIFELLSSAFNDVHVALDYFWFVTDFINAMQGVLIFIILVVLRKKVRRGLAESNFCGIQFPKSWKTLEDEECTTPEEDENRLENRQDRLETRPNTTI